MPTTLDMLETSYLEAESRPQPASTTRAPNVYDGCWASSGTLEFVVVHDRLAANPIDRVDPSGMFRLEDGYAVAERGDTANDLSFILYGQVGLAGTFYSGDPHVSMPLGTRIDVSTWTNMWEQTIAKFKDKIVYVQRLLAGIAKNGCDPDGLKSRVAKYEAFLGDLFGILATSENQQGIIARLGFGVTVGGISFTAGEVAIGLGTAIDKNVFLPAKSMNILRNSKVTKVVKLGGKVFTIAGVLFDGASGVSNLSKGNIEDGAADLSLAGVGAVSLFWPPAGVAVASVALLRLGVTSYYAHMAQKAVEYENAVEEALFDKALQDARDYLPIFRYDSEALAWFH
jgi:hypothetical protein